VGLKKNKFNNLDFTIPFLLVILNLVLKFIFITTRDIALDEPFSIYFGQMDFKSIIQMLYNENNPPLHFFILHLFIKLFGIGALSVRLPSLIFSTLTALMIYKTGKRFFNLTTGIGASLIFTFSTMHIYFSHEARVYPLFSLLTICSLYLFLSIVENPDKKNNFIYLFLCNLLLVYGHYFGFFVLFIEVACLLFISNWKDIWKKLFVMMTLVAICYVPIILIFFHRLGVSTGNGTWVAKPGITELYGNLNRFLNDRTNTLVLIIIFIGSTIVMYKQKILSAKINLLKSNINLKIVLIWFLAPYLIMFLVSYKFPMFIDRYILFTSIPFYITIAVVIEHFFVKSTYSIIAFSLLIMSQLFTMQLNPNNNRRLKELAMITKALKTDSTTTLIAPHYAFMGFCYYYNLEYFQQAPNTIKRLNEENIFPVSNAKDANEILESRTNKKNPCIYIQAGSEFTDPKNEIFQLLKDHYKHDKVFHVFEIYDIHYFTN